MAPRPRMLILEDEPRLADLYRRALARLEVDIDLVTTLAEARAALEQRRYAIFLVDLRLPDGNAADLLRAYREYLRRRGTEVIVLTAEARQRDEVQALGFDYYFEKPISLTMLAQFVQRLLQAGAAASAHEA